MDALLLWFIFELNMCQPSFHSDQLDFNIEETNLVRELQHNDLILCIVSVFVVLHLMINYKS